MKRTYIIKHKASDYIIPIMVHVCISDYNMNINNHMIHLQPSYIPKTLFKQFYIGNSSNIVTSSR